MTAQTILPANSVVDSGFNVDNSARFDGSSYLHRTPSATGNPKKWTYSVWVKMAQVNPGYFLSSGSGTQSKFIFGAYGGADIDILTYEGYVVNANTARLFRDSSAWYHMVLAVDTTQSAAANGVKLYINGVLETLTLGSVGSENGYTQDTSLRVGTNNEPIHIGRDINDAGHWKGYMAECALVNDAQLAPTSFGEFDSDSGIWKPIDISGLTFGTNGFHLDFKDSSAFGNDVSGNNNDFTVVGLAAIDQSTDTCTNNFATMNPLDNFYAAHPFAEGNTKVSTSTSTTSFSTATIGLSTGKWYFEGTVRAVMGEEGIGVSPIVSTADDDYPGKATDSVSYKGNNGNVRKSNSNAAYGNAYVNNNVIGVLLNLDDNEIKFSLNGTVQNSGTAVALTAAASTPNGVYFPMVGDGSTDSVGVWEVNFGAGSFTALSSAVADGNGFGAFEYAPPSGFLAICTKNLAENG